MAAYFNDPAYGFPARGGVLGQQAGPPSGILGGGRGSVFQQFLQPEVAFPMAAALIAGDTPQASLAGAFAQAGPALATNRKRALWNNWLKAGAKQDPADPTFQALMAGDADFAEKMALTQASRTPADNIRNDENGVPRYVGSGAEVFPNVHAQAGMFPGKSVMASGLNWLVDNKKVTPEQAAQLASSKQVTGADGTIYLATPQGVFGQKPGDEQATPVGAEPTQDGSPPEDNGGAPAGMIPLTGAKTFGSDDQTKSAGFAKRLDTADKILSDPTVEAAGRTFAQHARAGIPFGLGNYAVSEDYQKYDQASRNFINANLRRESGAAISESEFQNARVQYLPQPGDSGAVLKQKKENRRAAYESLKRSAGPLNQGFVGDSAAGWTQIDTPKGPLKIREKPGQ